jgi:hypothetical protein
MAQRKETKTTIKVRDLKPKKDAKGGYLPPGTPQGRGHSVKSPRSLNSPTRGN